MKYVTPYSGSGNTPNDIIFLMGKIDFNMHFLQFVVQKADCSFFFLEFYTEMVFNH